MPQFDILTLSSQIFAVLISLYAFYYFSICITIPHFIEIKKFRTKKLVKNSLIMSNTNSSLNNNLWLLNQNYKKNLF